MFVIITAAGQIQLDHDGVNLHMMCSLQKKNEPVTLLCVNFLVICFDYHDAKFKNRNMVYGHPPYFDLI
jgi:hypothetical protein